MKTFLKILTLFIAIGAVGGAVMMWVDPSGVNWGGEPMLDLLRAKMLWIVLEWWVWGFNALSNIYFVLGLVEVIAAVIAMKSCPKR